MIRGTLPDLPVAPTAHASEADTALTAFSSPVKPETAAGADEDGAAAAIVPVSATLPATADRTSRRPRHRIERTACAVVITDLPISGISETHQSRGSC
jgi:hypothetical protein